MNAVEYINSFDRFARKLGLQRMEKLLAYLDNPEKEFKAVHIAGTNGKGSTSAILSSIYQAAGYKIGSFNSPHLTSFNERIKINGENITEAQLVKITKRVKAAVIKVTNELDKPTYFEVLTAIAISYFAEEKVDLAVIEVGLGGRLDATNLVDSIVSIITNIGFDHTEYLGDTIAEIAGEKAGIIKEDNLVTITGATQQDALAKIADICKQKEVDLLTLADKMECNLVKSDNLRQIFDFKYQDIEYDSLELSLSGHYQLLNAGMALVIVSSLNSIYQVSETAIREGLSQVSWPGRFEVVKEEPLIILDGAHNPAAIDKVKLALEAIEYDKLIIVVSILADKDLQAILKELSALADEIVVSKNKNQRAASLEEISAIVKQEEVEYKIISSLEKAVNYTIAKAKEDDLILFTGSLSTVSEARELI